jgi:hypothetical protein
MRSGRSFRRFCCTYSYISLRAWRMESRKWTYCVVCVGSIRALVCYTSVLYVRWFTLHWWIFFFFCFVQNPDAADLRLLDSHLATVPLSYSILHYIDGE